MNVVLRVPYMIVSTHLNEFLNTFSSPFFFSAKSLRRSYQRTGDTNLKFQHGRRIIA